MRCVASAGLLALVGCNQIFGIAPTQAFDASIDVAADRPHVALDWQVATLDLSGAPNPVPAFAPIVPAPRLRLALLRDPAAIADDPHAALGAFSAPNAVAYNADGTVDIPREYMDSPWRLEYTLADGIPHEVQWFPDAKAGHIALPIFGRLDRSPPPSGSGYTLTPNGAPPSYLLPRVFTTGIWSEGTAPTPVAAGATLDYDFSNSMTLSGSTGAPDASKGDRALLVDYKDDGASGCRIATGAAPVMDPTLKLGMHSTPPPPLQWDTATPAFLGAIVTPPFVVRFGDNLGTIDLAQSFLSFGVAASIDMPGLAGSPAASQVENAVLPVPVMITLLRCSYKTNPLPPPAEPLADKLPKIMHVQLANSRPAFTAMATSGMETVLVSSGINGAFTMAFPAPFATQPKLITPGNGTIALDGATDQVDVGPAGGVMTLAFTPEVSAELRADYYDVILHRITGTMMTTERIYTIPAPANSSITPTVRIDGTLLTAGADYVFEIRAIKGHPRAAHGDFAPVDYPYGSTIVFTRTFKPS